MKTIERVQYIEMTKNFQKNLEKHGLYSWKNMNYRSLMNGNSFALHCSYSIGHYFDAFKMIILIMKSVYGWKGMTFKHHCSNHCITVVRHPEAESNNWEDFENNGELKAFGEL